MGVLKLGTVALDGTKIHANASRHSALSYEHAGRIEAQLQAEVADLMAKAEAADQADLPDGFSIPDELALREERLTKLAEARAKIAARAEEAHAREQAEAKLAARAARQESTGRKPGGRPPSPPASGPSPTDQINLTDADSRIMPVAGGGFGQCYNAQAVVAAGSLLVVTAAVVQAPNDKQQLAPMVGKLSALPDEVGRPDRLLADSGYFSAANVDACATAGIEPLIATADRHGPAGALPATRRAPGPATAASGKSDICRGPPPEHTRRQKARCVAQADTRAGVRHPQIRSGLPAVLAARPRQGSRRIDPRDHGLEPQAHVRPDPSLIGGAAKAQRPPNRQPVKKSPNQSLSPTGPRPSNGSQPATATLPSTESISPTGC